ncbi:uncharacterized protein LOC116163512 isoform X2 [Photinus pyralis]|uniref:uncharacterized protein LOC116163512 isoform X2 n=1 Tax=Photinus pyralis TaxID=7054 RepID=UPI00126751E7|nr:uncharacterized protein LOC116163512 isoform X2 [Photinus pyralis]
MQNLGKDICLKIDEAVQDTINFLLSVTQSNINQTAFKLIRQITCKRKNKVKGTLHGKSLELMKEPSDVSILLPHKSADVLDAWKTLAPTTTLARRNFRSSVLEIDDHDIVVVLDTTKPSTEYKYPIPKPTYGSQRLDIDLSEVSLKITLLPPTAPKEVSDDSLYLNDRYLTTEINKEYNKIMHIETIFNSPNRIINIGNCEEADNKEQEGVAPEEIMEHSSVAFEDVGASNHMTTIPDPVNSPNKSPFFIIHEKNNNTPSVVNPLEVSYIDAHEFSSICDRTNDANERYLCSLGNNNFIDSGIDVNNSIISKNSIHLNCDEVKAGLDFPLSSAFRNDNDLILIADPNYDCISKGDNNQSVREFIFSNNCTDQTVSTDTFCQHSNTANGQPDDREFIYNNHNVYMGASHTNDSSESLSISLNLKGATKNDNSCAYEMVSGPFTNIDTNTPASFDCVEFSCNNSLSIICECNNNIDIHYDYEVFPEYLLPSGVSEIISSDDIPTENDNCINSVVADGVFILNSEQHFLETDIQKINEVHDFCPEFMHVEELFPGDELPQTDQLVPSQPLLNVDPFGCATNGNTDICTGTTDPGCSLLESDNGNMNTNDDVPMLVGINSNKIILSEITPENNIPESSVDSKLSSIMEIDVNQGLSLPADIIKSPQLESSTVSPIPVNPQLVRVLLVDFIKYPFHSELPKYLLHDARKEVSHHDLLIETEVSSNNTEASTLPLSSDPEITTPDLFIEPEVLSHNTETSDLPIPSDLGITNKDLFIKTEVPSNNTEGSNFPLPSNNETSNFSLPSNTETSNFPLPSDTEASNFSLPSDPQIMNQDLFIETEVPSNNIEASNFPLPSDPEISDQNVFIDTEASNLPLSPDFEIIDQDLLIETEVPSNNTEASNLPLSPDFEIIDQDLFIETEVSSNNTEATNLPLPFDSEITCPKIYNDPSVSSDPKLTKADPLTSLDFAKAKQTLSARQCSQNCANIFCAHKPGSHITSLDIDSQIRQDAITSSQKHIEPESESGFIIFGGSNDQLSFLEETSGKESKLPFECNSSQNKQIPNSTTNSSRSSNVTVIKQQEQSKTGVKRSAEPDNSQNKRQKSEKTHKSESKTANHTSCSNNKSRWPLYNFSKPADCFQAVENAWDGLPLPDPHENLTTRYHDIPPNFYTNFSIAGSDFRTIDCLCIYEMQIEKVERKIRDIEYNLDQFSFNWSYRCIRQNLNELERLRSIRTKLSSACEEAHRFYAYYRNRRTGWSAWQISEYQKNEMEHILRNAIDMYPSYYGTV